MIRVALSGLEAQHIAELTSALQEIRSVTDVMVTVGDPSLVIITGQVTADEFTSAVSGIGEFSLLEFDPKFVPVDHSREY